MAFEQKIKRRPWTEEEKRSTLKACACKCACCGTKLNMKTLTMEHVVPISKGGDNVPENLVVLCKNCNSRKSNKLYWPMGFYMALNSGKVRSVHKYFMDWCNENVSREYLIEKPFLAEGCSMYLYPTRRLGDLKNGVIVPSLIMDFYEIGYEESAAILKSVGLRKSDVYKSVAYPDNLFSLFGVRCRTSDEYKGLYSIQFEETLNVIIISEIYCKNSVLTETISVGITELMSATWVKYGIGGLIFRSFTDNTAKTFMNRYLSKTLNPGVPYCILTSDKFSYSSKKDSKYGKNEVFVALKTESERILDDVKKMMSESK